MAAPICARCGIGLEAEGADEGGICGACMTKPPRFDRARAALAYNDASNPIILAYKHASRLEATPLLTRWLETAGAELLADADLVAPVPLHWRRMLRRRYNQAAELARTLARRRNISYAPDILVRAKATRSQFRLGAKAREANLRGAFQFNDRWLGQIDDARVLLIDDVFTTGATAERAAAVLKRAGANAVDVLTVARVERPRPT